MTPIPTARHFDGLTDADLEHECQYLYAQRADALAQISAIVRELNRRSAANLAERLATVEASA